jgi:hypothetical protein
MKCSNCDGVGTVEIMNCHDYSNECCGGCYITMMCDDCQGTGDVYSEDDEEEDYPCDILNDF